MRLSLRARLLLAIAGVLAATLSLAAWLFSRAVTVEFDKLAKFQGLPPAPPDIQPLLDSAGDLSQPSNISSLLARIEARDGTRAFLRDSAGKVIATSPGLTGAQFDFRTGAELIVKIQTNGVLQKLQLNNPATHELRSARGAPIGTLYLLPMPHAEPETEIVRRTAFLGATNQRLAVVVLAALALAVIAAFLLSRRILRPVESLTAAAQRMAQGDLKQRVAVSSADEIGELARAFNSMAVGLEHQEQLRRDMVSDVAHELRTPLTNIRCQLESVADGLAQPSPELLASMQEEVLHLSRLVDDLRDLALADAGQLSLHLEPVSIASAVENVVAALQPRIQSARITISQHVPADLPSAHADAMRLGQILRNLLENALAHTPQGGSIFIEARALEKSVRVEIRDTGSGVSPEHLPHIFDRFYRTDPSRSRETGGAGLGLAIVKQLVTAMDGTVSAESAPGKGSTFRIEFPCAQ